MRDSTRSPTEKQKAAMDFFARKFPGFTPGYEAAVAAREALRWEPGLTVEGEGVFVGRVQNLGKIFNVFAAPEDLTDAAGKKILLTFNDAVKRVAGLKDWHGHNGGNADAGEWFIPSLSILNALYAHKDKGHLKDSFTTKSSGSDFPDWYWSSTEHRDDPSCVLDIRFSYGYGGWLRKDDFRLSCRPVRLVEASVSVPAPVGEASGKAVKHLII